MIEFVFGVPRSAGDFFRGGEVVEHVEFFGLGGDGFDRFDEASGFELLRGFCNEDGDDDVAHPKILCVDAIILKILQRA